MASEEVSKLNSYGVLINQGAWASKLNAYAILGPVAPINLQGNLGTPFNYGKLPYGLKIYSRSAFAPIFAANLTFLTGVSGNLAPSVAFAGNITITPATDLSSGNLAPTIVLAADLDVHANLIELGGGLAPQIALGGSLSLNLPLTALDGGLTPNVVLGASSFISGPLWADSKPCPPLVWEETEFCPPPLWTPSAPPQWQLPGVTGAWDVGPYGVGPYNLVDAVSPWQPAELCDG
jgi:hypothetical protein